MSGALAEERTTAQFGRLPIDLMVTYRCNLYCKKCYAPKFGAEAPLCEIRGALDTLFGAGIRRLVLTGGEPLVRDDIASIARYAKERGFTVYLSTNGMLLQERWREISRYVSWVSISLDAPSEQLNLQMTGDRGAIHFERVLSFLSYYKETGPRTARIKLGTVITRKNEPHLMRLGKVIFEEQMGYVPDVWRLYQFSSFANHNDNHSHIERFSIDPGVAGRAIGNLRRRFPQVNISYATSEERDEAYIFVRPDMSLSYSSRGDYVETGRMRDMSSQEVSDVLLGMRSLWGKCIANREMYA